ncbi:MAG: hypothetical protein LC754_08005 [Acidobacteria bacterium]|nr:hypothetical protein [Acidobacteriota bacterium]
MRRRDVEASLWRVVCAALVMLCAMGAIVAQSKLAPRDSIVIVNNQPFRVRMPLGVRGRKLGVGTWETSDGRPAQPLGDDAVFIADVKASSSERLTFSQGRGASKPAMLTVQPAPNGVALHYNGKDGGLLSWDVLVRPAPKPVGKKDAPATPRPDFARQFAALPLAFQKSASGAVFDVWHAEAIKGGLKLMVELYAYHEGFLDINAQIENVSTNTKDVYAAAICRWQQPQVSARSLDYNNEIAPLGETAWSAFRGTDESGTGDFRHMFIQRGVDWINTKLSSDVGILWLNDFAPSFTVHQEATDKRPARYTGANSPQLGREAQTADGSLYSITEIARSNTRYYLDRFVPNVLPPAGEPLAFSSRLVFADALVTDQHADEEFIAYVGYGEQGADAQGHAQVSIGVPGVRFGTNYFPYSTLGENFTLQKLPGMDRSAYWPLAADTVTRWRLFADDIRRDLRIAKTMGFESIRLHHLELISPLDEKTKREYLDFLFDEIRHLKLRALIDAQMQPSEIGEIVRRYRDVIDGVEIENEVLIFGINDGREKYWNAVYDTIRQVDPNIPVYLTGHTNTGAFTRLSRLGVKFDRIGQHAYMDSLHAIPSARGFALAAANYGRKAGKPPIITEWNWRGLTRLTPEARAKVYAPIFENVLKTRSVPEIYQFQFNESLAMDPLTLKGIRHYEPLWFSRRPKPEALELMRLTREYSLPSNPVTFLDVSRGVTELDAQGRGTVSFHITNRSNRTLNMRPSLEAPANIKALLNDALNPIRLAPKASVDVRVLLSAKATEGGADAKPLPGFYHIFLRLEGDDGLLRYGWAEARLAGAPQLDRSPKAVPDSNVRYIADALSFDFNRPLAVVYGEGAPIQDLETAYALVNTLESATGRPVSLYQFSDLPAEVRRNGALILVGTLKTNSLVAAAMKDSSMETAPRFVTRAALNGEHGDWLVIGGATPEDAERAAMDLIIRYWKFAKDSAARRVPLVAKEISQGGDPALLP